MDGPLAQRQILIGNIKTRVFVRECKSSINTLYIKLVVPQRIESPSRKTEGPQVYSRYIGKSARAEWPTFLNSFRHSFKIF